MTDELKGVLLNSFNGGLATKVKSWQLKPNQSPDIRNFDLDYISGSSLLKRNGFVKYPTAATAYSAISTATGILSLYVYRNTTAGTIKTIAQASLPGSPATTALYYDNGSAWAKFSGSDALTTGKRMRYATVNDTLYFVNGSANGQTTGGLKKWDGSNYTNVIANTPLGAYFICFNLSRLWQASSDAYPSRVWGSALATNGTPTPEDYTTDPGTNTVTYDIQKGDGDYINGIVPRNDGLVIFKRWSIHILLGNKPTNFTVRIIHPDIGCVNPDTIAIIENVIFFESLDGIYCVTPDNRVMKISDNIQPTFDAMQSKTTKPVSGTYKNQYWMSYYNTGSTANNRALVLAYRLPAWVDYTGIQADCYFYDKTSDIFMAGSPTAGIVYVLNTGTTDDQTALNGGITDSDVTITVTSTAGFLSAGTILIGSEQITYTGVSSTTFTGCTRGANGTTKASHITAAVVYVPITASYETPAQVFEADDRDKRLRKAYLNATTGTGRSLSVDHKIDTVLAGQAQTVSLAPVASEIVTSQSINFPQLAEGKYLALVISDTSTTANEIYNISMYGKIQPLR